MLFLTKDKSLAISLLNGLLKYWPFANCVKETLFLTELQEVLEIVEEDKIGDLIVPLFRRIVRCIGGTHLQVADRAMCFFENDYFLAKLKAYKDLTFPMLVPVIVELSENHWHKILQESLVALKTILSEIDPIAFEEAQKIGKNDERRYIVKPNHEKRVKLDQKWDRLNNQLKANKSGYKIPAVPFTSNHLVSDYNNLYKKIYDKDKFINE
jgi:serine/threonine-protein phosphatase 2A regulatory subunit B'